MNKTKMSEERNIFASNTFIERPTTDPVRLVHEANVVINVSKKMFLEEVWGDLWKLEKPPTLTLSEYEKEARKTAIYPNSVNILYPSLGLAGEAGEIANKVKKIYRDDKGKLKEGRREEIEKELGDVLWYLSAVAKDIGTDLNTVACQNLMKLKRRQAENKIQGSGDER